MPECVGDNQEQNARGYLLYQILLTVKHPIVLVMQSYGT